MANFQYDPEFYDLQVNWGARLKKEIQFLRHLVQDHQVESVLDIGCGTAHHLQALSPFIARLTGIDPLAQTIAYGKKKVATADNIVLKVGGFEDLNHLDLGQFDLIMSLGNTLPLLKTRRKVKLALKQCRKKLAKGGMVLLQFLNFDRKMIQANPYYRPRSVKHKDRQYIFLKHFEYGKMHTRADFLITELDTEGKVSNFWTNSSHFCTLKKNLFLKMARNAGYKQINLLGPDGQTPFHAKKDISLYAILHN